MLRDVQPQQMSEMSFLSGGSAPTPPNREPSSWASRKRDWGVCRRREAQSLSALAHAVARRPNPRLGGWTHALVTKTRSDTKTVQASRRKHEKACAILLEQVRRIQGVSTVEAVFRRFGIRRLTSYSEAERLRFHVRRGGLFPLMKRSGDRFPSGCVDLPERTLVVREFGEAFSCDRRPRVRAFVSLAFSCRGCATSPKGGRCDIDGARSLQASVAAAMARRSSGGTHDAARPRFVVKRNSIRRQSSVAVSPKVAETLVGALCQHRS